MPTKVEARMTEELVRTSNLASKNAINANASDEGKVVQLNSSGQIPSAFTAPSSGLEINERNSDPANPPEGRAVIWLSDGTGTGDDGDVLIKITAGGVTKTATLVDFSGV